MNAQVDVALDTAIPAPTANSINQRILAIDDLTQAAGNGDLAAMLTDTNALNDTKVPDTISLANIKTQASEVLFTDTHAEETAIFAANAPIGTKWNFIAAFYRNKITQTETTTLLRNNADDGTIATSTVSDDATTFVRGEFS